MALPGALANLDLDNAIEQIAAGRMLKQIAADWGVSKVAVYKRLQNHPNYKAAVSLQAQAFVETAMIEVMECNEDTVNIARARVDAAFKYAKAHNPDYADKREQLNINVNAEVDMGDLARRVAYLASLQQSVTVDNSHGAPRLLNNDTAPSSD